MSTLGRSYFLRPLRDRIGRWLHGYIDAIAHERARKELAVEREAQLSVPSVWGPRDRLHIAETAKINDALFNTISGLIMIEPYAFLGHGVALLTGTHDINRIGQERQTTIPSDDRDIVIEEGAWIASRATVLGPCRIGANAVVAAGAIVNANVPAGAIVAGNPARLVSRIGRPTGLPSAIPLMTDVGTLLAHPHDQVITPYIRTHGHWDPDDCRLLERELAHGSVAVDVGANIGYMTLLAARAVGPTGTVIAVEPHPDNVALLRANIDRNGLTDRVRIIDAVAWDEAGVIELSECADNTGDHRVQTLQDERNVLQVAAIRLDDVVPKNIQIAVIKLDTQATEHRVLAGATTLLKRDRPVIISEFWPQGLRERGDDPLEVLAMFRAFGYELEVPDEPELAHLSDAVLTESIHLRPAPSGGFTTLRLQPLG